MGIILTKIRISCQNDVEHFAEGEDGMSWYACTYVDGRYICTYTMRLLYGNGPQMTVSPKCIYLPTIQYSNW